MSYAVDTAQKLIKQARESDHAALAQTVGTIPALLAGEVIAALANFAALAQERTDVAP